MSDPFITTVGGPPRFHPLGVESGYPTMAAPEVSGERRRRASQGPVRAASRRLGAPASPPVAAWGRQCSARPAPRARLCLHCLAMLFIALLLPAPRPQPLAPPRLDASSKASPAWSAAEEVGGPSAARAPA